MFAALAQQVAALCHYLFLPVKFPIPGTWPANNVDKVEAHVAVHSKLLINQRTFVMHTPEHCLKICHRQTEPNRNEPNRTVGQVPKTLVLFVYLLRRRRAELRRVYASCPQMIRFTAPDNTSATVSELTAVRSAVPRPGRPGRPGRPEHSFPQFLVLQTHKSFLFINIVRFWLRLFLLFCFVFFLFCVLATLFC